MIASGLRGVLNPPLPPLYREADDKNWPERLETDWENNRDQT